MAIILFLSTVALAHFSSISAAPKEVCETQNCQDYAKKLRNDMNTKINPCTNFYEYVCGNWNKNHPIPTGQELQSEHFLISDRTKNRLKEILTTGSIDGKNKFVKKAKRLYKGCMDTHKIKKNGIKEIMKYIKQTGGWPIIMSPRKWKKSKKPWQTIDSKYNVITGTSLFVDLAVEPAADNPDKSYLVISPSSSPSDHLRLVPLIKNDDDLFKHPQVVVMMNVIKKIAVIMAQEEKFNLDETQVKKDVQGIVRFLSYLRNMARSAGSNKSEFTTIEKISALQNSDRSKPPRTKINWFQRIRQLFVKNSSVKFKSSEKIIVHHKGYFKDLSSIPPKILERDIVNTIQWWFVQQALTYTNPEMFNIPQRKSRFTKCIEENELQYALAYVQAEKNVLEKTNARVFDMVGEVKVAMKEEIDESKWLDIHSKRAAKEKVDSMTTLIGYPDWYKDPNMLRTELYNNLLKGSSYLKNVLLAKQFKFQQQLESLGKSIDIWSTFPSIIDAEAYQINEANAVVFPAGILQKPLFNAEYPDAINYGGIGAQISHEMSHAFDSIGIHLDKHGNEKDWLSKNDIEEHEKRRDCFIDQFNKYGILGDQTLDENIADSTGVRAAFKTYKKKAGKHGHSHLSNFNNFTSDQLFFVSFASSHCWSIKPEFAKLFVQGNRYSPYPQRVIGALSNSEDFSKAFECEKNSPMNPSVKCTIL